jgi:hypothetical protein
VQLFLYGDSSSEELPPTTGDKNPVRDPARVKAQLGPAGAAARAVCTGSGVFRNLGWNQELHGLARERMQMYQ